jgi:transcriptional regulator with XRE-family HTH domain
MLNAVPIAEERPDQATGPSSVGVPADEAQRCCPDCGAMLRRTNAGSLCAACAVRLNQEPLIPQRFWYADDVATALAQWDLPAVVRLIHRKLGLTQVALANLTGYSQAHISRWLHRDGNPEGVTAARLRQFVENLGIPWELLGLIDPAARGSSGRISGGTFGNNSVAEEASELMKRRTLVVSGPLAMGATALGPTSTNMWHGKLGAAHARYLHQTARQLIEQNFRLGGDMLFTQAATQFETAYSKIRAGEYAASAEAELFGAVGELARCAAWIAHDAGLEREARYYFNEALLAARLSDNRQLAMKTYYSMSVQADEEGHPREAKHLVHAAQRAAKGWAPGRILSLLACAEARAVAGMRDLSRMRELVAQARTLLDRDTGSDFAEVFFFYNRTQLSTIEGLCYLKLQAHAEAESILRTGVAEHLAERGADYQRSTTMEYARLALAQLGQSNVTDATGTGTAVLATATDGVLSTRTLKVVTSLAGGLSAYGNAPVVRAFFEQLHSVTK